VTKARACKVAGQEESWEWRKMWGNEPSHSQGSFHFGSWSLSEPPNLEKPIAKVKTHWIENFLLSLESYWNINLWNGFAWSIWTLRTQVMAKWRVGSQIDNLIIDHSNSIIDSISLRAGGVWHTVQKISMRLQLCFRPHRNWRSAHKVMAPKSRESQLWEF
jgi:hypothetical protein